VPLLSIVLVTGDSIQGATTSIQGGPGNLSRELCCLLGARFRDVKETPPHVIKQDHHPLVVVQVGSWEDAMRKWQNIRKGLCIPWKDAKGIGRARSILRSQESQRDTVKVGKGHMSAVLPGPDTDTTATHRSHHSHVSHRGSVGCSSSTAGEPSPLPPAACQHTRSLPAGDVWLRETCMAPGK